MSVNSVKTASAVAVYSLWADHSPDVINRIAGLFAQHNFVPDLFKARALGNQLQLTVRLSAIDEERAAIIAAKIEALVSVQMCRLEVTLKRAALQVA